MLATRFIVPLLILLGLTGLSLQAQTAQSRFRDVYRDSTGISIDSLPALDDSVFVEGREYKFVGVDDRGEKTGLSVFDDLTLNLSLVIGEEEDRQLGFFKKTGSWIANFVVRVVSLSFVDLGWGTNRYFFGNEIFKDDLRRILMLYQDQGYFETRIVRYKARLSEDRHNIAIEIAIQEGKPTRLSEDPTFKILSSHPVVDPKHELTEEKILPLLLIRKGERLSKEGLEVSRSTIQRLFNQNGYPYAEIKEIIDTTSAGPRHAKVHFDIFPGRYTLFGETSVSGNYYKASGRDTTTRIVADEVILRKVRYKPGRPYNPDQLSLSVGEINGLAVFRSVKPIITTVRGRLDSSRVLADSLRDAELDSIRKNHGNRFTEKKVDLEKYGVPVDTMGVVIQVTERKERSIKPGVGFTTDFRDLPQSEKDKGLATLPFAAFLISWQSKNFLGGARKLQVSGQVSKGFQQDRFFANFMQAKVTFRQPSFHIPLTRNYNNDLVVTLSGERNNTAAFDVLKYEASPTLIWQVTRPLSLSLTPFSFTQQQLRRTSVGYDETGPKDFFTTNTKFGATLNTSEDFFYPTGGALIYFNSDFAGFVLPSDLKFMRLSLDNRKYFRLSNRLSSAIRARAGTIIPYRTNGSKTVIPPSEKYYGGGPNSIRGWGIKELGIISETDEGLAYGGGNSIVEAGVEVRYNLYVTRDPSEVVTGMDLAGFVDVGNVWTEYNFKNVPAELPRNPVIAVGGGMRIRTLIGPVRVDVGYKLIDPKNLKVIGADGTVKTIDKQLAKDISRVAIQITLGQAF